MKSQKISYINNHTSSIENTLGYSVKCTNKSSENKYIYIFQRTENQTSVIASLVWVATKYKVPQDGDFTFEWQDEFSYFWQGYGSVQPKVVFEAQGSKGASPETEITFLIQDSTPIFEDVKQCDISGMRVTCKYNIPENQFGVGIGMSNVATFLVQAIADKKQEFGVNPIYWIACSDNIKTGMVLSESSKDPKAKIVFPNNTFDLEITYEDGQFYMNGIKLPSSEEMSVL
jgi:hypothetical protein